MASGLTAEQQARKDLVREIAVGIHVARGGKASDFDLPSEDRRSAPGRSFIGNPPHAVMTQARRVASERLAASHWDEYTGYLTEAIGQITAQLDGGEA